MRMNARDILSVYVTSLAHIIAPGMVVLLVHLIWLSPLAFAIGFRHKPEGLLGGLAPLFPPYKGDL